MRRRSRRMLGLALLLPLPLLLAVSAVRADTTQTGPPADAAEPTLGGFTLTGRANAVRVLYDLPGSLPIGPLVDVAAPEASARLATGPVGSALSAIGYPGPVVLGGEALLAQGGFESPLPIPDYPLAVSASSSGPTNVRDEQTVPGGSMHARAEGTEAEAVTVSPSNDASPVLLIGGSRSVARAAAGTTADVEATVEVGGIVALGGLLRIDAVTSTLRASSDGAAGRTEGGTVVSGATFLGQPVEIDGDGIRFTDPPAGGEGPLTGALGPVADAVALERAIADVLGQFGSLEDALAEAGISVRLAEPRATGAGAGAERVTEGLTIELEQELGRGPLGDLLALVPLLPDVPGAPVGANDLVQILQARQVSSFSIGRAEVAATAAPAFAPPPFATPDMPARAVPGPVAQVPAPSRQGPSLGGAPTADGAVPAPGEVATGPVVDTGPLELPGVVGPGAVLAAVAGGILLSLGTRRLPDWAMDGTRAVACDRTPPGGGP